MTRIWQSVNLREWAEFNLDQHPRLLKRYWDDAARETAEVLKELGVLEVTEVRNGLRIRANSHVGRVSIAGLQITILPKIDHLRLYRLLKYAYGLRNLKLHGQALFALEQLSFQDLVIHHLCAEVEELIARGLDKRYHKEDEDLVLVRGRINIRKLAERREFARTTLPCTYFARTENSVLNQVILAGIHLALTLTNDPLLRSCLRRLAKLLDESVELIPLSNELLLRIDKNLDRLNEHYRPALKLINILFLSQGQESRQRGNHQPLPSFFFDMNRFFQVLLSRLLKEYLEAYTVRDEFSLYNVFAYEQGYNPKKSRPPKPRPDFAVFKQDRAVMLLDAKYKDLWNDGLPTDWLYQLAIYAASGVGGGSAKILYPTTERRAKLQILNVTNPATGSSFARIMLQPVQMTLVADCLASPVDHFALYHHIKDIVFEGMEHASIRPS